MLTLFLGRSVRIPLDTRLFFGKYISHSRVQVSCESGKAIQWIIWRCPFYSWFSGSLKCCQIVCIRIRVASAYWTGRPGEGFRRLTSAIIPALAILTLSTLPFVSNCCSVLGSWLMCGKLTGLVAPILANTPQCSRHQVSLRSSPHKDCLCGHREVRGCFGCWMEMRAEDHPSSS